MLRPTSPKAASKAKPQGPRGDSSVAPTEAVSGPPQHLTSALCSVLPATAARAEGQSAEQLHLDTPCPVLNSPAQEESEDSDREQAFARSKPRQRRPVARAAQTERATAHSPCPSAQESLRLQKSPAQELTSQQLAPAAAPAQYQPPN